jgi:hypothetical protein
MKLSPIAQDGNQQLYLYMDSNGVVTVTTNGNDPGCEWTYDSHRKTLYNQNVKMYLNISSYDGSTGNLNGVGSGGSTTANWYLYNQGGQEGYAIQSQDNTSYNLNVAGNSYPSGTKVIAYGHWHGAPNEVWTIS